MDDFVGKTMPAHGEPNSVKCGVHTTIAGHDRVRIQRSGDEWRERLQGFSHVYPTAQQRILLCKVVESIPVSHRYYYPSPEKKAGNGCLSGGDSWRCGDVLCAGLAGVDMTLLAPPWKMSRAVAHFGRTFVALLVSSYCKYRSTKQYIFILYGTVLGALFRTCHLHKAQSRRTVTGGPR